MTFSPEVVRKVAHLARLRLTDAEQAALASQLGAILSYVEQLQQVDTTGVEPLAHGMPSHNRFRVDQRQPSFSPDEILANAPKRAGDFYSVPAILD
jgi:aspartyl-tRNA(Asn)/glutamyl-tRNA(Gln) amidotransferase subunit C